MDARPDLELVLTAADIFEEDIKSAKAGVCALLPAKLDCTAVCEKMSLIGMDAAAFLITGEIEEQFDQSVSDAVTLCRDPNVRL